MSEAPDLDFFAELDTEISKHQSKAQLHLNVDKAKKSMHNMKATPEYRSRAREEYREAQALLDLELWMRQAAIAMFTEQKCDGCGSTHRIFLQYMHREVLVRRPTSIRWVRTMTIDRLLPRESLIQTHHTHICADCCLDHGFAVEAQASIGNALFAPSPTYEQEDLNAQVM